MRILIKDQLYYGNTPWAETMNLTRGQWVEVNTEFLFKDQFNTYDVRVMLRYVDAIEDDMRRYRKRCSWCGHHSALVSRRCEYCKHDDHFERFFPHRNKNETT